MEGRENEDRSERLTLGDDDVKSLGSSIDDLYDDLLEQFGSKMNQGVNGNRRLFWKEVSNVNGGKVENSSRIKDGIGRLVLEEAEV